MLHLLIWNMLSVKKGNHIINFAGLFPKSFLSNQCQTEKYDHVMPLPAYLHGDLIRLTSLCMHAAIKWFIIDSIHFKADCLTLHYPRTTENFSENLHCSCRKRGNRGFLQCIRWIQNWFFNSMSMYLFGLGGRGSC